MQVLVDELGIEYVGKEVQNVVPMEDLSGNGGVVVVPHFVDGGFQGGGGF